MEFTHPCHIIKAEENSGRLKVLIRASTEGEDRHGERVLKSAFADPDMQRSFSREGYYDYNHITDILDKQMKGVSGTELVELQKAKARAIIGYPDPHKSLFVGDDGVYSQGYLFADNEYVQEIRKGLESGWSGWGASISGFANPADLEGNTFKKIGLKKIAIAPLQEVINPDTSVQLAKSKLVQLLKGGEDYYTEEQTGATDTLPDTEIRDQIIQDLQMQVGRLTRLVLSQPSMQEAIAREVVDAIKCGTLPLQHDPIVSFLTDSFGFDTDLAKQVANGVLLTGNFGAA